MQLRLGGAHVGPLLHKLRRQADGQILRQVHAVELERLGDFVRGKLTGERGELVARLRQLLLQRRQRCAGLRQLRFLRQHVGLRCTAEVEALPHQVQ